MPRDAQPEGLYRAAVRWGLLAAGLVTAAMRAPELWRSWGQWHALQAADPSAAESYRTFFAVEGGITLFILAMAAALFFALQPRRKKQA